MQQERLYGESFSFADSRTGSQKLVTPVPVSASAWQKLGLRLGDDVQPRPGQGPCAHWRELGARHPHPHGPVCPARAPLTPPCTLLGSHIHLTPTPTPPSRAPHGGPSRGLGASARTRSPWSWARTGSQYGFIGGLMGPRPQAPHQPASTHTSSSGDPRGLSGVSLGPEGLIMSQESQGPRGPAWDTCWGCSWKPASLRDLSGVPLPLVSC